MRPPVALGLLFLLLARTAARAEPCQGDARDFDRAQEIIDSQTDEVIDLMRCNYQRTRSPIALHYQATAQGLKKRWVSAYQTLEQAIAEGLQDAIQNTGDPEVRAELRKGLSINRRSFSEKVARLRVRVHDRRDVPRINAKLPPLHRLNNVRVFLDERELRREGLDEPMWVASGTYKIAAIARGHEGQIEPGVRVRTCRDLLGPFAGTACHPPLEEPVLFLSPIPLWKTWWFWTAVGAGAVLVLGIGLGVGLADRSPIYDPVSR